MTVRIGRVQKRVIHYLASHPNQNMQVIQRELGIPDRNYTGVRNALITLKENGYVKSKRAFSAKKVKIDFWTLTKKGVAYVMAYGDSDIILDALKKYEGKMEMSISVKQFADLVSRKTGMKIFRIAGKAHLHYGEEFWNPNSIAKILLTSKFNKKEMDEIVQAGNKVKLIKLGVSNLMEEVERRARKFRES